MSRLFLSSDSEENRGEKKSSNKKNFNLYKKNAINSLNDVECFLNNFNHFFKYIKLYKIIRK